MRGGGSGGDGFLIFVLLVEDGSNGPGCNEVWVCVYCSGRTGISKRIHLIVE
jgi:hypothetical protein